MRSSTLWPSRRGPKNDARHELAGDGRFDSVTTTFPVQTNLNRSDRPVAFRDVSSPCERPHLGPHASQTSCGSPRERVLLLSGSHDVIEAVGVRVGFSPSRDRMVCVGVFYLGCWRRGGHEQALPRRVRGRDRRLHRFRWTPPSMPEAAGKTLQGRGTGDLSRSQWVRARGGERPGLHYSDGESQLEQSDPSVVGRQQCTRDRLLHRAKPAADDWVPDHLRDRQERHELPR